MSRIVVTGAASGLGSAIIAHLDGDGHELFGYDRNFDPLMDVRKPDAGFIGDAGDIDILVNCAGINKTGWLQDVSSETWDEVMDVNAKGIFMMTQAFLPALKRTKGTVLNIVSNASHMPMTCSAAYNASKGAAHILTLQLARELGRNHGITVFGISPNKLAGTGMSRDIEEQVQQQRGWTAEQARAYQLASLPAGEETDPERLAEFIAFLLLNKSRHKYLAGCILPYGA